MLESKFVFGVKLKVKNISWKFKIKLTLDYVTFQSNLNQVEIKAKS